MKDSGVGSFMAGVAIGGLVGAAIGLLMAPEPGTRLREQVGEFVDGRRTAFDDAVSEGRAAAEIARAEMLAPEEGDEPDPAPAAVQSTESETTAS
jgi:gas vesicle protein